MKVKNPHILVIDDDINFTATLQKALADLGRVDVAHDEDGFRALFRPYAYDLVMLDLRLREGREGLELLEFIIEEDPSAAVVVISGYGDIATAVEALDKGAKTFLEKGRLSIEEIKLQAAHTIRENIAERRIRQLEADLPADEIIGDDPKIAEIRRYINLVAEDGEATVMVRGDTGTGKELVARAIHRNGKRRQGPFVTVALPDRNRETITSELFGHEKGAFTGADGRHAGFFEQAHRGVLFLDEIGDLPKDVQTMLLRVLEERRLRRVGGKRDIEVDVQLITATNRSLEEMLREGTFREDLYYRLKVFQINLPPLKERAGDIPLLAAYFLRRLFKAARTTAREYSREARTMMQGYDWPGNVRELRAVIESAALRARLDNSKKITVKYLSSMLTAGETAPLKAGESVYAALARQEMKMVAAALESCGGKKTEAWKLLGYRDRFVIRRRIKKLLDDFPEIAAEFPGLLRAYQDRSQT